MAESGLFGRTFIHSTIDKFYFPKQHRHSERSEGSLSKCRMYINGMCQKSNVGDVEWKCNFTKIRPENNPARSSRILRSALNDGVMDCIV